MTAQQICLLEYIPFFTRKAVKVTSSRVILFRFSTALSAELSWAFLSWTVQHSTVKRCCSTQLVCPLPCGRGRAVPFSALCSLQFAGTTTHNRWSMALETYDLSAATLLENWRAGVSDIGEPGRLSRWACLQAVYRKQEQVYTYLDLLVRVSSLSAQVRSGQPVERAPLGTHRSRGQKIL